MKISRYTGNHRLAALLLALLAGSLLLTAHPAVLAQSRSSTKLAGVIERVSVSSTGEQANGVSQSPAISADGRFVAFVSWATNLVSEDTSSNSDIFVHDRQTGETERVSVSSSGEEGYWNSADPAISADGRFVAFDSYSSNLVSGDTNQNADVFVHDRQTGVTERVSVSSTGEQGNSASYSAAISGNGRFVTFASRATNLISGDTNDEQDVFVHDRQTGVTELISVSPKWELVNASSYVPKLSTEGRFVAFVSDASNLLNLKTGGGTDIYVRDRQMGMTERVSVATTGEAGNLWSSDPSISADGRFVAFSSLADNLVGGDTELYEDIFVYDRCPGGDCANPHSYLPVIMH